jgi:acetyltransferase
MWRYTYNLRGIYETPSPSASTYLPDRARASEILSSVRSSGRTILNEYESKKLVEAYGIPIVSTEIAETEDAAVEAAGVVGYPVVLKLHSFTISHKTDVGGVILNLPDAASVRDAFVQIRENVRTAAGEGHFQGVTVQPFAKHEGYELILGSSLDPQFGPVLLFGTGGQLVEVFQDRSLALPPLNTTLARRMMEQTRIYKALKGVRGRKAVDMLAMEELMVRFSDLVIENPAIKEIDINPILASSERLLALDARVVVHDRSVPDDQLPRSAIRPYPARYVSNWTMKDGEQVTIRPIRPEDEPLVIEFHKKLSERTVYLRYFQPLKLTQRTAHERLTRICFIDYDREMALVVERRKADGTKEIIAIGRLSKVHGRPEAELAALVQDEFQGKGIGTELYRLIIQVARDKHLKKVHSNMLGENREMQRLCKKLGFRLSAPDLEDNLVLAELQL